MNPTTAVAGLGRGWTRVAEAVGEKVPAADIARIWVFSPIQREDREWGTAVVARHADAERVVIYTARYVLMTRGKERGQGKVQIDEVGESPFPVASHVIHGVQERLGEGEPPTEIDPETWFGDRNDEPASQS